MLGHGLVFHAPEDGDDHAACGGQIRAKRRDRQTGHQPRVIDIRNIVIVPAAGRDICKRQAAAAEADINVCRTARHGKGIRAVAVFGEFEALAVLVRDRDALHSGVPARRHSDRDLGARAGIGLVDLGDAVAAVRNLHREAGLGGLAAAGRALLHLHGCETRLRRNGLAAVIDSCEGIGLRLVGKRNRIRAVVVVRQGDGITGLVRAGDRHNRAIRQIAAFKRQRDLAAARECVVVGSQNERRHSAVLCHKVDGQCNRLIVLRGILDGNGADLSLFCRLVLENRNRDALLAVYRLQLRAGAIVLVDRDDRSAIGRVIAEAQPFRQRRKLWECSLVGTGQPL